MLNRNLEEIEKIIVESSKHSETDCLAFLRDELIDLNYKLPKKRKGEKKAYEKVLKIWREIREKSFPLKKFKITELSDLPGTKICIDGVNCYFHGIVHTTGISNSVKNFVTKSINKYHKPEEGKICLLEDNLYYYLKPDNAYLFYDENVLSGSTKIKGFAVGLISPLVHLYSLLSDDTYGLICEASRNIKFLPVAREAMRRTMLPEPLFMNYIMDSKMYSEGITERSRHMANEIKNESRGMKEVHAIAGFGHETQVEYFLKGKA